MSTVPTESSTTWTGPRHPRAHYLPGVLCARRVHATLAISPLPVRDCLFTYGIVEFKLTLSHTRVCCYLQSLNHNRPVNGMILNRHRRATMSAQRQAGFIQTLSPFLVPGRGTLFEWRVHFGCRGFITLVCFYFWIKKPITNVPHHSFWKQMIF